MNRPVVTRRQILLGTGAALTTTGLGCRRGPAVHVDRPRLTHGVQAGDTDGDRALVWARSDRPAELRVEWDTTPRFARARRVRGPAVDPTGDLCGVVPLAGLPAGQTIFYRVVATSGRAASEPVVGQFASAPGPDTTWRLAWSGDTCGQGFGIDPAHGGLRTYASIRAAEPHGFLHVGDLIYADNPIPPEIALAGGGVWRNQTSEVLARVAESLDDFRARFAYPFGDPQVRDLAAEVAIIAQWDDHETRNNWWPAQLLDDDRYRERRASVLAARARQAMFEWLPITRDQRGAATPIQRVLHHGPHLDVVVVDLRSFRTASSAAGDDGAPMLGADQARWLVEALAGSRATWKIVACDQPLGLIIPDGDDDPTRQEGWAQPGGPARGRERELAWVLAELDRRGVDDVVWLTADVHYAAAHHYDPARALVAPFRPFWEFVAGPLHAGSFGPNPLDPTFGPELKFQWAPPAGAGNLPPSDGLQSFGTVTLDGKTRALTVRLHGRDGEVRYEVTLPPSR